jgi:hypothetical protein
MVHNIPVAKYPLFCFRVLQMIAFHNLASVIMSVGRTLLFVGLTTTSELRTERERHLETKLSHPFPPQAGNDRKYKDPLPAVNMSHKCRSLIIPIMLTAAHRTQYLELSYKSTGLSEIQFEFRTATYIQTSKLSVRPANDSTAAEDNMWS